MTQQRLHERNRVWYFVFYGRISQNADFLEGGLSERRGFSLYNYLLISFRRHGSWGSKSAHFHLPFGAAESVTPRTRFCCLSHMSLHSTLRRSERRVSQYLFLSSFSSSYIFHQLRIRRALDFWNLIDWVCFQVFSSWNPALSG
jgi:hypothetical protein